MTFGGEKYEAFDYCEIIHPDTAEVLAEYNEDFYAQSPAVTVNNYGQGKAYYIAFRGEEKFIDDFFASIDADIYSSKEKIDFPEGVTVRTRENESNEYFFVQNWNENSVSVNLKAEFENLNTGKTINGEAKLDKYETLILKK